MEKNKPNKKPRHPPRDKGVESTYTPASISLGDTDTRVLTFLLKNKGMRLNIKRFAETEGRKYGIKRSTVYDSLKRLIEKGLAIKPHIGNHKITEKGEIYLKFRGVESPRWGCREKQYISQHNSKFILELSDKSKIQRKSLRFLNPIRSERVTLRNNHQDSLYFEDATITITSRKAIIWIHDIITDDPDKSDLMALDKALGYVERLRKIGITEERLVADDPHFARIDSPLANFLEKIDNRYRINLKSGWLWIDRSHGPIEDETDSKELRKRIDNYLKGIESSESTPEDVDNLIRATKDLVKIKLLEEGGNVPKLAEVWKIVSATTELQKGCSAGLLSVIKIMTPESLKKGKDLNINEERPCYLG